MTTLRKTSKEYKEVIKSKGWKMYDLYFGFKPQEVENCAYPERIKKVQKDGKNYIVTIHGNLWYKKAIS